MVIFITIGSVKWFWESQQADQIDSPQCFPQFFPKKSVAPWPGPEYEGGEYPWFARSRQGLGTNWDGFSTEDGDGWCCSDVNVGL